MSERKPANQNTAAGSVEKPQVLKDFVDRVMMLCTAMLSVIETMDDQNQQCESETGSANRSTNPSSQQINALKSELKRVASMNVSWQTAHKQQHETIARLTEQLEELRQKMASRGELSDEQQADIDRMLLEQKRQFAQVDEEKCKLEEENRELRERAAVLEMQVSTYKEDFETERRDRERAQGRVAELEQLLNVGVSQYAGGYHTRPMYQTDRADPDETDVMM